MNFFEGFNYQNYTTIDKTREITEKLVESNKKFEENYDSNKYELGIFKESKYSKKCHLVQRKIRCWSSF